METVKNDLEENTKKQYVELYINPNYTTSYINTLDANANKKKLIDSDDQYINIIMEKKCTLLTFLYCN